MPQIPALLIAASACILFVLGTMHLLLTFKGNSFDPRDEKLKTQMQAVTPWLTRQTSMWRAWVGFNASHSYGAMLFGLVYGYLALVHPAFLFASVYLCTLGLVVLLAYLLLARLYWFKTPFRGIALATALYLAALAALAA